MHAGKSIKAMAAFFAAALFFTGCSNRTASPDVLSDSSGSEKAAQDESVILWLVISDNADEITSNSFAAQMLCAYYDKTCDSEYLFRNLAIAASEQYAESITPIRL